MPNFKSTKKQANEETTGTVENDTDNNDVVSDDTAVHEPVTIPQVEPKAGLFRKLFVLQHTFDFIKDSSVNAGRMKYDFTSMSYWWKLVQPYFKRNELYPYWRTETLDSRSSILIATIRDLVSGEEITSRWLIPLTIKESGERDGVGKTVTTSMIHDGAYLSYFQRRTIFAMCGLITNEDAEAELDETEGRERRSRKQPTSNKSSMDW